MDWYLKLRTNYGRGNQNGLLTLGNDETVLSPHPVRNLTKRRKPQRSCSPWLWILTLSSTNSLPRTHTGEPRECAHGSFCLPKTQNYKNSTQNKGSSLYIQTEKRNLVWLLRASRQGTGKHRRRVTESKLTQEKTRMARVLWKTTRSLSDLHARHYVLCWETHSTRPLIKPHSIGVLELKKKKKQNQRLNI